MKSYFLIFIGLLLVGCNSAENTRYEELRRRDEELTRMENVTYSETECLETRLSQEQERLDTRKSAPALGADLFNVGKDIYDCFN